MTYTIKLDDMSSDIIGDGTTYTLDPAYGAIPNSSITIGASDLWTTTTTNGIGGYTWANITAPQSAKISLQGPEADIEVNGESLMSAIRRIEERLNILKPNEKLEAEWDQLRELVEQYRALEKKLQEQSDMWNTLKTMPAPEIK